MRITSIQLAKRVEKWQKVLAPLGVGHWRIDCVSIVDETPGGPGAQASVQPHHTYDNCTFWFTHHFVEAASPREMDETIVHEWLHVAMRGFDESIGSIEDALSPGVCQQWEDWVNHEREGLIERMARLVVASASAD